MKISKLFCYCLLAFCFSLGYAQIGEPLEGFLQQLDVYTLSETEDGYEAGNDFLLRPVERGDVLYRVAAEGSLDEVNLSLSTDLIAAGTGYGSELAEPLKEFFETRLEELVGQGSVNLALGDFAMSFEVLNSEEPFEVNFEVFLQEIPEDIFPLARHSLGPEDATYVIREFSDFQCPFCARFSATGLSLIKEELLSRGDVRFEFHHFPLQSIHANALGAAEAAECVTHANTPEDFWPYHDVLFERQQAWQGLSDPNSYFVRLAEDIGLSTLGVEACLEDREFAKEIEDAYQVAGAEIGVRGTPSVYVNGFKLQDYTQVETYLKLFELSDKFSEE